jgi:phosphatidylinositol alpha-1,6-mannosyltransferase
MRLNVLFVSRNLPPMIGGMERLNWHLADELSQYCNLTIIGPSQAEASKPVNAKFIGTKLTPLWRFLVSTIWLTYSAAKKTKPDIILAGSGLSALATLISAKLSGAKSTVYVHGLDIAVKHPIYKLIWLPAIKRMDLIIANSSATADLVRKMGINENRICIINPGVAAPKYKPDEKEIARFRTTYDLEKKSILLSVGRLTHRKGLIEFVNLSLPAIIKQYPNTILLVIGSAPSNALYAQGITPENILQEAKKVRMENNIKFIGTTDEKTLMLAFNASSAHIFPIKEISGDPEGFGMVAIEAAIHGLPTVAFRTGGVIDAVKNNVSGYLIPPQSYDLFAQSVLSILKDSSIINKQQCIDFALEYEWKHFGLRLKSELSSIK